MGTKENLPASSAVAAPIASGPAVPLAPTVSSVPAPATVAAAAPPAPVNDPGATAGVQEQPEQLPGTTARAPATRPEPPAATVLPVDEFHGRGGDFVIGEDGIRRPAGYQA